ncbi:hypothetical protein EJB05_44365 [Eragrostis curvula]|uniref:Transposase-associated domain-containing protein n=1 Tax=Eragrostis curvula TaxID=38414 RepID=A0A5J9THG6_9POAL|nr:hypothetical protein EJB05_44365 [Eragrostis curvula]
MEDDDHSWMLLPRSDDAWLVGFEKFIENTFEGTYPGQTAPCPCIRCRCMEYTTKVEVQRHLLRKGFAKDFIKRKCDAVKPVVVDDDQDFGEGKAEDSGNVNNLLSSPTGGAIHREIRDSNNEERNEPAKKFIKLMEKNIYNATARKLTMTESNELGEEESRSTIFTTVKEDLVFQEAYKETTGTKSTKLHGHGYSSNPSKNQLLQKKIEEQAREIQKLKEQLAKKAADKEAEKEQLKASIKAQLMEEFQTLIARNTRQPLIQEFG